MLKQNKTKEEEREKKIFGDTSHLKCCYQWTWYSWMELAITRICAYFCAEYHVEMALKKTFPQNIQCEWKLNTRFITFNRLISSVEGFWASAMRYRAQWSGEKKRHRSRFVAACSPNDAVFLLVFVLRFRLKNGGTSTRIIRVMLYLLRKREKKEENK